MFEFLNIPTACVIIMLAIILIGGLNIKLCKQKIEEWEAMYAPEDKE